MTLIHYNLFVGSFSEVKPSSVKRRCIFIMCVFVYPMILTNFTLLCTKTPERKDVSERMKLSQNNRNERGRLADYVLLDCL